MLPGHELPDLRWPSFEQGIKTDVSKHPCQFKVFCVCIERGEGHGWKQLKVCASKQRLRKLT